MQTAERLLVEGNLAEAEAIYRDLLAAGTEEPAAYANLAVICGMGGRDDEMEGLLLQALALKPAYPEALANLGIARRRQGDLEGAIDAYRRALELQPDSPENLHNLGIALRKMGDPDGAVAALRRALELRPDAADTLIHLGLALLEKEELEEAIPLLRRAVEIRPDSVPALTHLGVALRRQEDAAGAIGAYRRALAVNPDLPEVWANLGAVLQESGDPEGGLEALRRALVLRPDYPEVLTNLGVALRERGDLEESIACQERALALRPEFPSALVNLGIALRDRGDLDGAIASYERALAVQPEFCEALSNLGNARREKGDLEAALACYERAMALKPSYALAHWNHALTLLLLGEYGEGWRKYEWRWKLNRKTYRPLLTPSLPRWDGESTTDELLLVGEQGLGDILQFVRYAPRMHRWARQVSLCVHDSLVGLVRASGVAERVYTVGEAAARTEGSWLPLLSVPGLLGVTQADPVVSQPYLRVPPERAHHWRERLRAEGTVLVGLNWQGNPESEKTDLRGRSFPLEVLAPLAAVEGVRFLSLQKGAGSEQLETCPFRDRFVACQAEIGGILDFVETAAMVQACDLVITSDTVVAHLAGGLGRPTWLLLRHLPEWRWGLEGESSPWYPSMRLFRQEEPDDWTGVVEQVREALEAFEVRDERVEISPDLSGPPPPPAGASHTIPVSIGELIDKITILEIKAEKMEGPALVNVRRELDLLTARLEASGLQVDPLLRQELKNVNAMLWVIEDEIRAQERRGEFGERFIHLARSVYRYNDSRAAIKKRISLAHGSELIEEKSYAPY